MLPNMDYHADSKVLAASRSREVLADAPSATGAHYSARFITGAVLIASSFLPYLAYPILLLLPASGSIKVGVTIVVSVLSWAVFGLGIFLTGPEGYALFKALCRRMIGALSLRSGKQPMASVKKNSV